MYPEGYTYRDVYPDVSQMYLKCSVISVEDTWCAGGADSISVHIHNMPRGSPSRLGLGLGTIALGIGYALGLSICCAIDLHIG